MISFNSSPALSSIANIKIKLQIQRSRHSRWAFDVRQLKRTTSRIESIKKRITNNEKKLKIKVKFHATDEISGHVDLMKTWGFFSLSKKCQCRYNWIFIFMACDLRLDEHTAQMYVSIDVASSGHVTHKDGHIKAVWLAFSKNSFHQYVLIE